MNFKDPVCGVGTSQTFSEFSCFIVKRKVHWLMLKQQGRGVLRTRVPTQWRAVGARGAHYAARSPRGAPINSARASIWVRASSSSASPTHCRGKETWGDADLTSLSIWTRTFAQLRVSSCRARNAFMHI